MGTRQFLDDVTALDEAAFDTVLLGDVGASSYVHAIWAVQIRWTGSAWEGVATYGATDQIANLNFTPTDYGWVSADRTLRIGLNNIDNTFVNAPIPIVTPHCLGTSSDNNYYRVQARPWSNIRVDVQFFDNVTTPETPIATEDTNMRFGMLLFGRVAN